MADAEHRVLDRGARQEGTHLHRAARFQIAGGVHHFFEVELQQLPGFAGKHLRDRIAPRRHV